MKASAGYLYSCVSISSHVEPEHVNLMNLQFSQWSRLVFQIVFQRHFLEKYFKWKKVTDLSQTERFWNHNHHVTIACQVKFLEIRSSLFNFMNSYHALALKVWINIFSLVLPLMLRTSWYEHKCTCTLRLSFCNLFCDKLILIKTGLCIETFMNCCLGIDD